VEQQKKIEEQKSIEQPKKEQPKKVEQQKSVGQSKKIETAMRMEKSAGRNHIKFDAEGEPMLIDSKNLIENKQKQSEGVPTEQSSNNNPKQQKERYPTGYKDTLENKSYFLKPHKATAAPVPTPPIVPKPVRRYETFPLLKNGDAQVGDLLAFNILELTGWVPEVALKEATVLEHDTVQKTLKLKLSEPFIPKKPEPVEGDEEYEEEEEEEEDLSLMEVQISDLSDIRIIERAKK